MIKSDISKIAHDVLMQGSIGLWIIEIDDGKPPRMYGDKRMHDLLNANEELSPEDLYLAWYDNVHEDYYGQVNDVVNRMITGVHSEVQYPWHDSVRGYIKVRCGGTRDASYTDGIRLQGYHQDITDENDTMLAQVNEATEKRLQKVEQVSEEYLAVLASISTLYFSMHLINLADETVVEYMKSEELAPYVNTQIEAGKQLCDSMLSIVIDEHVEAALEFVNLSTLQERLEGKKSISDEFIGKPIGWFNAEFIVVAKSDDGTVEKVLFTTRVIDDQKKREERLLKMSNTDGLTGLNNRRCYEEHVRALGGVPDSQKFAIVSLDVNGLKHVNDTMGHDAGDELIMGAAYCMQMTFGSYGEVYRMGGDEFEVIVEMDPSELTEAFSKFETRINSWKGNLVDSLSISYGYVTKSEFPTMTVENMAKIADKRMYEAKSNYYITSGIDRRKR